MSAFVVIVALGCVSAGCSEPENRCTRDDFNSPIVGCIDAQVFAARDTTELIPSQTEVDRYFDRWRRALDAEPQLKNAAPIISYRFRPYPSVKTRHPAIIAAWRDGELVTGEPAFDEIISDLKILELNPFWFDDGGTYTFGINPGVIFSEERFEILLNQFESTLGAPVEFPGSNSDWSWSSGDPAGAGSEGDVARIDAMIGWGDCLSGCIHSRRLRAIVPREGEATVFDLGGDPLPAGSELATSTRPL